MSDPVSLDVKLHPAQMVVFNSPARFSVLAAGRRFGKTNLATARAAAKAMDPRNVKRKPVFVVAPVATQAKLLYWQGLLDLLYPVLDPKRPPQSNEGHIYLRNGVMIGVKGADRPDTLRGVGLWHTELDEYADMKPEVWESILRPALADVKGTAGFIGTPKGRNHFYELYMSAGGEGAYRGPGRGTPVSSDWAAFHYVSLDNPFLDPSEIEAARTTMTPFAFRQEFLASFETGTSESFEADWIVEVDEEPKDKDGKPVPGDWFVTVDLAGFAGVEKAVGYRQKRLDNHAIAVVKVLDDERWYVRDLYLGRWGVEETARRVVDAVASCETMNLGIEKGALYQAVAPYLESEAAKRNIMLSVEPLSHENKTKTERILWALQGRMSNKRILFRRGPHMKEVRDQFLNFPSSMVHDDAPDVLAYIPQLAAGRVFHQFARVADETYWEPSDAGVGL
ncbi:MAG TPA: terminase family protein [Gemmatimonadaceae bacterium]|nr:terminase family protein [Gemmatimonadaceae bacterium]